jgi:hypothetical protein
MVAISHPPLFSATSTKFLSPAEPHQKKRRDPKNAVCVCPEEKPLFLCTPHAATTVPPLPRPFLATVCRSATANLFSAPRGQQPFAASSSSSFLLVFYRSYAKGKKRMPPKKKEEEKKILLGRPGNNLKSGIVRTFLSL